MRNTTVDLALAATAGVALAAVGAALVSQHRFDMQPCPWCVLQRLVFVCIAVASLLGLAWRRQAGLIVAGVLVGLLSLSGAAAALWQHFVAAASASCNLTLADRLMAWTRLDEIMPEVFQARASCMDAAVDLLGLRYEFWSLALFVAGVGIAAGVLRVALRGANNTTLT